MIVHWLEQRGHELPTLDDWLHPVETLQLATLQFEKRRNDWRLGRWTAKLAVAAYLKLPRTSNCLANILIRPEPSGAPEVWLGSNVAPVVISLSHSNGTAACAIANKGVMLGCDLELIEPRSPAFLSDYFTSDEQAFVALAAADDQPQMLALLWSAKESALKALRIGLRMDTRSLTVTPAWGGPGDWRPLHIQSDSCSFGGWWTQSGKLVRTVVSSPPPEPPRFLLF